MNKQLAKTLNSISQRLPKLIRGFEKVYNAQAIITIEKIDRPLLLTRGEIQQLSDFINLNPTGMKKELYISSYMALYGRDFFAIPSSRTDDFELTDKGMDIIDFLVERGVKNLKVIVHLDLFQSFEYDPPDRKLHWFKIQVATPKDNKTVAQLVQDEVERRETLDKMKQLRARI